MVSPTLDIEKGSVIRQGSKAWVYAMNTDATAHVNLTPYRLQLETGVAGGWVALALADDTNVYKIGIAMQATAASAWGLYQIEGDCANVVVTSDNYTAGHGLEILNGTAVNSDAAYAWTSHASTDCAMVNEAGTAATAIDLILTNTMATAQT